MTPETFRAGIHTVLFEEWTSRDPDRGGPENAAVAVYTRALRDVLGLVIDQGSLERIQAYAQSVGIDLTDSEARS